MKIFLVKVRIIIYKNERKNEMDLRTASGEIGQWHGMKVVAVRESNFVIDKANWNTIYALTNGNNDLKMVRVSDNGAKLLGMIDKDGNVREFDVPKVYKTYSKPVENKFERHNHDTDECPVRVEVEYAAVEVDMDYIERLMKPIDEYIHQMLEKSYDFSN